jgi:hypothetical protein
LLYKRAAPKVERPNLKPLTCTFAQDPEIDSPTESSPSSSFSMIDSNKTGSYHRSSSSTDNALEWAMRR